MRSIIITILLALSASAWGHQFIPTYPELRPSYVPGIVTTRLELFNSRKDIEYYEVGVFDGNWNKVPFATDERIFKVSYLGKKYLDIYIRNSDIQKVVYICTTSKLLKVDTQRTVVSSKICSKVK